MTIRVPHRTFLAALGFFALTATAPSQAHQAGATGWRAVISSDDAARLARLDAARAHALGEARALGGHGDIRAVMAIVDARPHAVPADVLAGTWRCRQTKLGGASGYYVFDWFTCRIRRVGGAFRFEKQGTQRMAGTLYPDAGGRWIYLGAQSARGEPWHRYSGNAASLGPTANPDDQVGVLAGIGDNRLRIELPLPATGESDFDVIELVR